jgi:tetratricopeptide (TPR) repeat protein
MRCSIHLGCAREALGDAEGARAAFDEATRGLLEPASPLYYNDQPPGTIYYQGLAWQKLGRADRAAETFRRLVDYGAAHISTTRRSSTTSPSHCPTSSSSTTTSGAALASTATT